MSDENKEILDQVTELITSKKEQIKEELIDDKKVSEKNKSLKKYKNSRMIWIVILLDSLIKKELQKWIEKNAEKIAKEIINEQAKKSLNSPKFEVLSYINEKNYICTYKLRKSRAFKQNLR